MKRDLTSLLREWAYQPGQLSARIVEGDDGEPKLQVRLDLGIIQMNTTGRPDGQRPRGHNSLLEYFEARLDRYLRGEPLGEPDDGADDADSESGGEASEGVEREGSATIEEVDSENDDAEAPERSDQPRGMLPGGVESKDEPSGNADRDGDDDGEPDEAHDAEVHPGREPAGAHPRESGSDSGPESGPEAGPEAGPESGERFVLTPEDCRLLRDEAVQYYHRYLALLVLEDFEGVVRDTTRNLRVLDLCAQHAQTEGDRTVLEQFRPYITMMRARAMASQAIKDNEPKAAVQALDEALEALQSYFSDRGQPQAFEQSSEVEMLRGMRDALVPKLPVSQKSELRTRLQRALDQENYELAAILRDELKQLKE